ncbi:MAG TPA: hypothetical protein VGX25_31450 [Actinophytocola sp.]|nr:hypothetical protein [Actinophytocola sp.]HEV2783926.1 hypothetical protein [Actinophytocola sp.]
MHHDEPPALATDAGNLVGMLGKHWTVIAPLHRWLVTHLQGN